MAARRDGDISKPKQRLVLSGRGDRAGFSPAELWLPCSSRAVGRNRPWSFMGTEIYHKVLAKTASMDIK